MPDANRPIPASFRNVPGYVQAAAKKAGTEVTQGLPNQTWNGMTEDVFTLGTKSGEERHVHLLPPGVHPARASEAKERFAWSEARERLWTRLEKLAPELISTYGITHVAGGGSFFTTDHESPGDIDLLAFRAETAPPLPTMHHPNPYQTLNRNQGEHGIHVYPHEMSIFFAGGPSSLWAFRYAPPNPRPRTPSLSGPRGPEVGMVLLDLAELTRAANDDVEV